jgi:hypothetical protein
MVWKILGNILGLGIPSIIRAIAKARRQKREQLARLKQREATKDAHLRRLEKLESYDRCND